VHFEEKCFLATIARVSRNSAAFGASRFLSPYGPHEVGGLRNEALLNLRR
jgi:hypothetical protein